MDKAQPQERLDGPLGGRRERHKYAIAATKMYEETGIVVMGGSRQTWASDTIDDDVDGLGVREATLA